MIASQKAIQLVLDVIAAKLAVPSLFKRHSRTCSPSVGGLNPVSQVPVAVELVPVEPSEFDPVQVAKPLVALAVVIAVQVVLAQPTEEVTVVKAGSVVVDAVVGSIRQ